VQTSFTFCRNPFLGKFHLIDIKGKQTDKNFRNKGEEKIDKNILFLMAFFTFFFV